jgi:hypothetical protein
MPPARLTLYIATVGVLAVAGHSLLASPPPFEWAALILVGYGTLLLGGVLLLRWRVFVDALVRGPRGARGVALTFDDGPDPRWTPRVLEVLAKHRAVATFFVIGRKAEAHPELVRAILDAGHSLGLHSYEHDRLFAIRSEGRVRRDLERAIAVLEAIAGHRPVLFGPPIGHTYPIIARVRRDLQDGAIVLLHDAPERGDREPAAVRALPAILDAIGAAGLEVQAVTKWLELAPERSVNPGVPRYRPRPGDAEAGADGKRT